MRSASGPAEAAAVQERLEKMMLGTRGWLDVAGMGLSRSMTLWVGHRF